jgi:4-carboxymuconolactone decarboxylase
MSDELEYERQRRIEAALQRLTRLDPTWASMFQGYVLDGMYTRETIPQKTRELCAVAALTVLDRPSPLRDHIKGALRQGATISEIFEVIAQCSVYGGFPVTMSAIEHLEGVLEELGIEEHGTEALD